MISVNTDKVLELFQHQQNFEYNTKNILFSFIIQLKDLWVSMSNSTFAFIDILFSSITRPLSLTNTLVPRNFLYYFWPYIPSAPDLSSNWQIKYYKSI